AQARGHRPHRRLHTVGQLGTNLLQTLGHLLAGEVQVRAFLETYRHLRQAVTRDRTRELQVLEPGHVDFDGPGDALLHLQRRIALRSGVDLHLYRGDVRAGVDGQLARAPQAQA